MEIAQALKKWRKENKISQQEIAEKIGTKQTIYSRYERGEQKPGAEIIKKIAETFHVSADILLGIKQDFES